jgi:hypothetical protein
MAATASLALSSRVILNCSVSSAAERQRHIVRPASLHFQVSGSRAPACLRRFQTKSFLIGRELPGRTTPSGWQRQCACKRIGIEAKSNPRESAYFVLDKNVRLRVDRVERIPQST